MWELGRGPKPGPCVSVLGSKQESSSSLLNLLELMFFPLTLLLPGLGLFCEGCPWPWQTPG